MRTLAAAAALALLLAGCSGSGSLLSYFPPEGTLPEGVHPHSAEDPAFQAASQALRLDGNPGRIGAADSLAGSYGNATDLYAWLLQDSKADGADGTILVVVARFGGQHAIPSGEAGPACQGTTTHILHDGLVYIFVAAGARTERGRAVAGSIADTIQERTGATRDC